MQLANAGLMNTCTSKLVYLLRLTICLFVLAVLTGCTYQDFGRQANNRQSGKSFLMVVPSEYTVVQLAFNVARLRPVSIVAYDEGDDLSSLILHYWDAQTQEWRKISSEDFNTGNIFEQLPTQAIYVDASENVKTLRTKTSWSCQSVYIPLQDTSKLLRVLGGYNIMHFNKGERKTLAKQHSVTIDQWSHINTPETQTIIPDPTPITKRYGKYNNTKIVPMPAPPNKTTIVSEPSKPKQTSHSTSSQRWAVIIGVSSYQDTKIPSLRYASSDAQAFYDWCISSTGGKYAPARTKLLLDKNATSKNMKKALFNWLGKAIEEDIVTIYFSGHGSPQSPDNPDNLFLLPYDTQYDDISTSAFPMWDMETALKRYIKAKKVIIIADACHAGGVGESFDIARRSNKGIKANTISAGVQGLSKVSDGVCVISASDNKQLSQEGKQWGDGHGVFTYHLIEGLKGKADYSKDDIVTLGELIPYLSENVRRATKSAQSPTVAGKFDPALSIGK